MSKFPKDLFSKIEIKKLRKKSVDTLLVGKHFQEIL